MDKVSSEKHAKFLDIGGKQESNDANADSARTSETASIGAETGAAEIDQPLAARRLLGWYKESIALAKDTLDVVWKFVPICLFFPAAMLWNYLHKIGWDNLFSDAVVTVPGFIVMIVSSCVLLLGIFLQFCVPSILTGPAATLFKEKPGHVKKVAVLHLLPSVVWFTAIAVLALALDLNSGIVTVGSLALTAATAIACVIAFRGKLLPIRDKGKDAALPTWGAVLLLALCPTLAAMATSAPLLLCLSLISGSKLSAWLSVLIFLACGCVSMLGMAPGLAYLLAKVAGKSTHRAWRATGLMCLLVGYVVLSVTLYFAPVSTVILRIAGVIDQRPRVYQVLKPDLVPAMRAVGIYVAPVKRSAYNGEQTTYFIGAFSRFSFNNVELLCSHPFSLEDADASTWANANVEETRRRSLVGGDFCVKVHSDELRPLRRNRP
ncbi:hypothetical protein [Caballeronia sp. LjRoot31]|uniref:hypothetical protein n=1 Tax=Caballeronia sp. LjRoot31 TaxID=3342324 RepID=UPI003ED070BA